MRVLCTGPESSGTRLLTRIVATGEGIEAIHRSIPHYQSWDLWVPEVGEIDKVVFISRAWNPTIQSQVARGLVEYEAQSIAHLQRAHVEFAKQIGDKPWWYVIYHNLIYRPDIVLSDLEEFLGVSVELPEEVYNANFKWNGPRVGPRPRGN